MNNLYDTIAAVSTPRGKGGIAVIRISGKDALCIASSVFVKKDGAAFSSFPERRAVYGNISYKNKPIDDGILVYYPAPNSITGEDVIEISCHGGMLLAERVLESVLSAGAVPAEAGEFSKRAFLSGKLSLTEAESIIDSIDAVTDEQITLSLSQRLGSLSGALEGYTERLKRALSSVYAYADYPDEDMRDMTTDELKKSIDEMISSLTALSETYSTGHAISEGIKTVIAGKPNVGKSSVLNAILERDRAIVTDIPGTTRDTLEEEVNCGGALLRISDTAGIHDTSDEVESIGIERAVEKIKDAELILAVFDSSAPLDGEDRAIIKMVKEAGCPAIFLINKTDIRCPEFEFEEDALEISAKYSDGIDKLKNKISGLFIDGEISLSEDAVISNARQNAALQTAIESLRSASNAIANGFGEDTACLDLEAALSALTGMDGRGVGEAVVEDIFARFCVGK